MYPTETRVVQKLQSTIENELSRLGLLFRVFSRAKSERSIDEKVSKSPGKYSPNGKKIQDLFGVRVALYFPEDVLVSQQVLSNLFELVEETVDDIENSNFSAVRCNYVYELPDDLACESAALKKNDLIDSTFEIQFRTVLSEGWHEVEHDLRYKCSDDWVGQNDLDRALNGIYASLETSDWGMTKVFDELAYRHYKEKNWGAMLRNKFRLRTGNGLKEVIHTLLNEDNGLGKKLYRAERSNVLKKIASTKISVPINLNNLVFLINYFFIKSPELIKLTPLPILHSLNEYYPDKVK
jgi:putative GTP pyrophosphokinase